MGFFLSFGESLYIKFLNSTKTRSDVIYHSCILLIILSLQLIKISEINLLPYRYSSVVVQCAVLVNPAGGGDFS